MSLPESGNPSTARRPEGAQNKGAQNKGTQDKEPQDKGPQVAPQFDFGEIEAGPVAVGKINKGAASAKIAADQSRRGNLMIAMIAMLLVGTANLVLGGYGLIRSAQGIKAASRNAQVNNPSFGAKEQIQQATESATLMSRAVFGTQMLIGAIYLLLGFTIHNSALNKAILGLVLYAAMIGVAAATEPAILTQGLFGLVFIGVGLIAAVVGAFLYERGAKPAKTAPNS